MQLDADVTIINLDYIGFMQHTGFHEACLKSSLHPTDSDYYSSTWLLHTVTSQVTEECIDTGDDNRRLRILGLSSMV